MRVATPAILLGLRQHGEHGAVVRMITPEHGLQAAYVRGARGQRMRPVLIAGNLVQARLSARTDSQLPQAEIELTRSRAPLLAEPLPAAAIEWASALTATTLPEAQPFPQLYRALDGLLSAVEAAPAASGWGPAMVLYELLILAELGFGLDLTECALCGAHDDLIAVSPRSGRAVSAALAEPFVGKLLRLPRFMVAKDTANLVDVLDGLALTGHFLMRDVRTDRAAPVAEARMRLVERLERAAQ